MLRAEGELLECFRYVLMSKSCWNLDIMVSPLWSDAILPEVPHLSQSLFEEAGVISTWSTFPEGWTDALVRCCGLP